MLTQYEKPVIRVAYTQDATEEAKKALCSGIEEEMIPYELYMVDFGAACSNAFEAAQASRLEVGVALTATEAALHYRKLKQEKPLFYVKDKAFNPNELHKMGSNAARLVKGISFKE